MATTQPIGVYDTLEEKKPRDRSAPKARAGAPPTPLAGTLWFGGWLFTIGFAKLVWWKALLGVVVWPYFLGSYFH